MQVKVLSVKNPYAYLIIHGGKDVENRTWNTEYRGRLYIHVSGDNMPFTLIEDYPDLKSRKEWSAYVEKIRTWHNRLIEFYKTFGITIENDTNPEVWKKCHANWFLKSQSIIGYVDLVDVVKNSPSPWAIDGQYHWILKNPTPLKDPIRQVKGRLGLWNYNLPEA